MSDSLLGLIGQLVTRKVKFDDDKRKGEEYEFDPGEEAGVDAGANVVTSAYTDGSGHALLIDIDVPAWLVPSSTPGHSHLYVSSTASEAAYLDLLKALKNAGVIQAGYEYASAGRKASYLRLPWVKKEAAAEKEPF